MRLTRRAAQQFLCLGGTPLLQRHHPQQAEQIGILGRRSQQPFVAGPRPLQLARPVQSQDRLSLPRVSDLHLTHHARFPRTWTHNRQITSNVLPVRESASSSSI